MPGYRHNGAVKGEAYGVYRAESGLEWEMGRTYASWSSGSRTLTDVAKRHLDIVSVVFCCTTAQRDLRYV